MLFVSRFSGVAGPGEIFNWIGYLGGHTVRRLKAITYIKVLVIKDTVIDHRLANEKQSFQQFQKMAARTQDALTLQEALLKHGHKSSKDENKEVSTYGLQSFHLWDKTFCHTVKYSFVVILHLARMVICLFFICANRTVEKMHSDGQMTHTNENGEHSNSTRVKMIYQIHMDMMYTEECLRWSLLGLDIVTNSLEFVVLTTQAYYSKHGIFVQSFQHTFLFALKTQLLLWFLAGFPFEKLAGTWPYAQCLAANRLLGFWRIYAMKKWIVQRYPSKIKIFSILWVIILYFAFLLLFTFFLLMKIEFTCNPNHVESFMICYIDQINQYGLTIGDPGFIEQADTLASKPYQRTIFMNSSDCWLPDHSHNSEEKSIKCQHHYDDLLRRYWTFSRLSSYFGEGGSRDYKDMENHGVKPSTLFVVSIYYSAQTLTLTGFGEFVATYSDTQVIFYIALIMCSYILNSYISIQFLAPSIEDSKNDHDHYNQLELQIQYLKYKNVPEPLMHELCHYINCQHINTSSIDQFLEEVPDLLLREFKFLSFREMLRRNLLFKQEPFSHIDIINLLAAHVHPLYLPQSATLLRNGDVADMIYFQAEGEVLTRMEQHISCSGVDQVFGDLEEGLAIWQCTVTTLTPSCLLVISKVNILKILHMYPLAKHNLKKLFHYLPDYCCHGHPRKKGHFEVVQTSKNASKFSVLTQNQSASPFPSFITRLTSQPLDELTESDIAPSKGILVNG